MEIKRPLIPKNCFSCSLFNHRHYQSKDNPFLNWNSNYCANKGDLTKKEQYQTHACHTPALDILLEYDRDFCNVQNMKEARALMNQKYECSNERKPV